MSLKGAHIGSSGPGILSGIVTGGKGLVLGFSGGAIVGIITTSVAHLFDSECCDRLDETVNALDYCSDADVVDKPIVYNL